MDIKRKSEVIAQGYWPDYFIENMASEVPDIRISSATKLTWKCPIHGDYVQTIGNHLMGKSCPVCSKESARKKVLDKRAGFTEEQLSEINKSPDKVEILKNEFPYDRKFRWICEEYGVYEQTFYNHFKYGCPLCRNHNWRNCVDEGKRVEAQRLARRSENSFSDSFIKDLEGSPDRENVLTLQFKRMDKVRFVCKEHGIYEQSIDNHMNGAGCPTCAAVKSNWVSEYENKLANSLRGYGVRVNQTVRNLIKGELDLYLPDYKLAVEVNGLYWHSYEVMMSIGGYNAEGGKYNYHLNKTIKCEKNGIQLIHLFEDDIRDKYEICINLILSKCGLLQRKKVYARKCTIHPVPVSQSKQFLEMNHIQGPGRGECYGLYLDDVLLSLIQVKKAMSNTEDKGKYILDRYCSDSKYFVIGGFEKLISHLKSLGITTIVTYADRTISDGSLYLRTGFRKVSISGVDYKYVYKGKRYHKFNFRKERFKTDDSLLYKEGLTENELAIMNKINRIYDCGKIKFEKEL